MVKALINSGCTHTCISEDKIKELRILAKPVNKLFKVFNADRAPSGHKLITHYADITLDTHSHKEQVEAVITTLDSANMFLGHDWLIYHNPEIN
ncbi:hypothetical protein AN958_01232 [Leucoagaricus sp. SymC.cos]|nr:hypothetical protein AN958_01232 [Leucoagaricus sp. SymC.cos]